MPRTPPRRKWYSCPLAFCASSERSSERSPGTSLNPDQQAGCIQAAKPCSPSAVHEASWQSCTVKSTIEKTSTLNFCVTVPFLSAVKYATLCCLQWEHYQPSTPRYDCVSQRSEVPLSPCNLCYRRRRAAAKTVSASILDFKHKQVCTVHVCMCTSYLCCTERS